MLVDELLSAVSGPWGLIAMSVLVFADAFLVVVPGEVAVTMLGAVAAVAERPPLWAVIGCAALAAVLGDVCCYLVGRTVGLDRWRWLRGPRVSGAITWARGRLDSGAATVLFTARFVPFARLAVNLAAGATRLRWRKYLPLLLVAATAWAAYQAVIGAVVASLVPGMPVIAVLVSVAVAVGLGLVVDLVVTRRARRARPEARGSGHPER
ncbi:DedA family protein [Microbacterium gorillae]|uniref:DedA family protein n=1 Tax=Microbacterium gorillae TaxID=1231063 RepID=UPI000693F177|nr:VTT domain-containing protein [Microbacterium gorillae]